MRTRSILTGTSAAVLAAGILASGCGETGTATSSTNTTEGDTAVTTTSDPSASSMLVFTMRRIDGTEEPLSHYQGSVVLVVNVASKCGLTPQYAGLESLYASRHADGLVVLGFPANDFMGQEPGTNEEIAEFCSTQYNVTFPMFAKIEVTGDDAHPLFRGLAEASEAPTWNFTKYLLDRNGRLVKRFGPKTAPDDPELVEEIDRLLGIG